MKKGDLILIATIIVAALVLWLIWSYMPSVSDGQAVVRVDGQITATLDLTQDNVYRINGTEYACQVTVKDGRVAITQSPCPDQICVNSGFINQANRSIVCLPNRLSITVETEDNPYDVDTITY